MPFASSRAIFEHSGGTITWFGKSKTVRAISENREIEFRIGSDEAKVNNQSVHLEKKAFIDHGRSIVPLSFFKDSMDVDVKFDAATGRIRIETKK